MKTKLKLTLSASVNPSRRALTKRWHKTWIMNVLSHCYEALHNAFTTFQSALSFLWLVYTFVCLRRWKPVYHLFKILDISMIHVPWWGYMIPFVSKPGRTREVPVTNCLSAWYSKPLLKLFYGSISTADLQIKTPSLLYFEYISFGYGKNAVCVCVTMLMNIFDA